MKTMMIAVRGLAVLAVLLLTGCGGNAGIKPDPAALHGDYSGKDASGSFAVIRAAGDIPGVPESKGKYARWSSIEVSQILYLDADCQKQLFGQLPSWAQAIVEEGGWSALATAVGEAGFASAFPGAEIARYFLGGLGYGFAAGTNAGRYRQDTSMKASVGYCVLLQVWEAKNRYHILEGINIAPWYGNGRIQVPRPVDNTSTPALPHVQGDNLPPPR